MSAPLRPADPQESADAVSGFVPLVTPPASDTAAWRAAESAAEADRQETPTAEAERPSFFSRLRDSLTRDPQPEPVEAGADVVSGSDMERDLEAHSRREASPQSLATVPPTPEAFQAIRAEKDAAITELKADHALAQETKQELAAEPSQTAPQPLLADSVPPPPPPPSAPAGRDEPVLLGHIAESKTAPAAVVPQTQAVAAPVEFARDAEVAPKEPETNVEAPATGGGEQWWKRWSVMGESTGETGQENSSEQTAPLVDERPRTTVPEFTPAEVAVPTAPAAAPLVTLPTARSSAPGFAIPEPPTRPSATPQNSSEETDSATGAEDASASEASQKAKAKPPSRYDMRARDRQFYLVP
jgi:hypothetical protein